MVIGETNSLQANTKRAITTAAPMIGNVMPVTLMPQAFMAVNSLFPASEARVMTVAKSTAWGAM